VVINDDDFAAEANSVGSYNQKRLRLNGVIDNNTSYFIKLRSKLNNLGNRVLSFETPKASGFNQNKLVAYPNPAYDDVILNKHIDGVLYDNMGLEVMKIHQSNKFNVKSLNPGIYLLKTDKESVKLIVK
jgi:hypothetical protein